jgi:hypothetical protein
LYYVWGWIQSLAITNILHAPPISKCSYSCEDISAKRKTHSQEGKHTRRCRFASTIVAGLPLRVCFGAGTGTVKLIQADKCARLGVSNKIPRCLLIVGCWICRPIKAPDHRFLSPCWHAVGADLHAHSPQDQCPPLTFCAKSMTKSRPRSSIIARICPNGQRRAQTVWAIRSQIHVSPHLSETHS